ncbi:hypothetical protein NDU88_003618 [Pleurodeles waltl]|uniref:Uncharacterized protein n=1 Tax=Pleurodeles waltl TaxID=8319 RepID=A0AAV7LFU2_PLEWA|nr:hypothetical protein NDU88_003618 [Pleurodeles waltl]
MAFHQYLPLRSNATISVVLCYVAGFKSISISLQAMTYLETNDILCLQENWALAPKTLPRFYEIFKLALHLSLFGSPSGGISIFNEHSSKQEATAPELGFTGAQAVSITGLKANQKAIVLILVNCYLTVPKKAKILMLEDQLDSLEVLFLDHPRHEIVIV